MWPGFPLGEARCIDKPATLFACTVRASQHIPHGKGVAKRFAVCHKRHGTGCAAGPGCHALNGPGMTTTSLQRSLAAQGFDPDWYLRAYPDVGALGMDPAVHFLEFGHAMGRQIAPGVGFDMAAFEAAELPAPPSGRALLEAHEIARQTDRPGRDAVALHYARQHVPAELAYTIRALEANAALRQGDQAGWLAHLNAYLDHFGAAPIHLAPLHPGADETLPERFRCAPLPAVTGGPLISVIMPAWNAEKTVRAAARSILDQSWRNLELLIVDDFSSDGTWAELQRLAAEDARVKILRNAVNVGPYVSKNIALDLAKGAWITGHDADDWAHPQRLEQHMRALQQSATPPRASVGFMLRFEPDGMMDRFAVLSNYSLDGVARLAAISCTYEAKFLKERLGRWDNIRFGADSELIARSQALIGAEFAKLPLISMLCMNFEGSLTNNASFGVDRLTGPSEIRNIYTEAYKAWHKGLRPDQATAGDMAFPPATASRPFPAPEAAQVPRHAIRRNHALHTGRDPALDEGVTAICASKRPQFAERVARMLDAQTHEKLHLIYVAHGPGHDLAALRKTFAGLKSVKVLELPDADQPLGAALNLALDHCQTDLCAKIDDDDFYGPNYIRAALAALRHSGHDKVGIVGRGCAFVYVEDSDRMALRFAARHQNTLRDHVYGGTLFWSRKALGDQRFAARSSGEDSDFLRKVIDRKVRIFSAEAADYVHLRYVAPGAHTWQVTADDFLSQATPLGAGLRLDLAYSTASPPRPAPIPGRAAPSGKLVEAPRFTALLRGQRERVRQDPLARKVTGALFSKARMKAAVRALVPGLRIPRTLGRFARIEDFVPPEETVFVLKPDDGSYGRGVFVLQKTETPGVLRDMVTDRLLDRDALIVAYRGHQEDTRTRITGGGLLEELVAPRSGQTRPDDFKFLCFGGEIGLIHHRAFDPVDPGASRFRFWSPDWQDLGPVKYPDRIDPTLPVPPHAAEAVQLAKRLSAQFPVPFCRIDLYINEDGVFFGETTPFPNGGVDYFDEATDTRLAALWAAAEARLPGIDAEAFLRAASLQADGVKGYDAKGTGA